MGRKYRVAVWLPPSSPAPVVGRFQDQDGIGFVVKAQPGEVGEAGVRAEAVVGVVGADLQRAGGNDQALAGEPGGDRGAAGGRVRGDLVRAGSVGGVGGPGGGHERLECLGVGALGTVVHALFEGLVAAGGGGCISAH